MRRGIKSVLGGFCVLSVCFGTRERVYVSVNLGFGKSACFVCPLHGARGPEGEKTVVSRLIRYK